MSKNKKSVERPLPTSLGLPCVGVDSHAHLDPRTAEEGHLTSTIAESLGRARQAGLSGVGQVFLHPDVYAELRGAFIEAGRSTGVDVFFLLGIHPCDGQKCTSTVLDSMRRALPLIRFFGASVRSDSIFIGTTARA